MNSNLGGEAIFNARCAKAQYGYYRTLPLALPSPISPIKTSDTLSEGEN